MALLRGFLDLVYPRACAACGRGVASEPGHICWECRAAFRFIEDDFCEHCGDPVDGMAGRSFKCSACVDHRPAFDRARSAIRYRGPARRALQAFKYEQAPHLGADFAPFLTGCVRAEFQRIPLDSVTFVPLHAKRERERTYNQSRLLAQRLARDLALPLVDRCLVRVRATATQTDLTAAARRRNVRGAFQARERAWVQGRRFLLVDDVMTTGATVDECARVLKGAGAAGVFVATVARG
jgi:ComF family protein